VIIGWDEAANAPDEWLEEAYKKYHLLLVNSISQKNNGYKTYVPQSLLDLIKYGPMASFEFK
jgi:hypothetical protein